MSDDWTAQKQQGNTFYGEKKYEEAIDAYSKALNCDIEPSDRATLLCNRAQCYLMLNKFAEAIEDCTSCLTSDPQNLKGFFRR